MNPDFATAYDELVAAWEAHRRRRVSAAHVADLLETRLRLDRARLRAATARRGLRN